jgi:type I restriction enzyme R subunit
MARTADTGLTPKAFAAFWALRDSKMLKSSGIDPIELAKEIEKLLARFPNAKVNADEQRQLRASLYRPLITLPKDARTDVVELIMANVSS